MSYPSPDPLGGRSATDGLLAAAGGAVAPPDMMPASNASPMLLALRSASLTLPFLICFDLTAFFLMSPESTEPFPGSATAAPVSAKTSATVPIRVPADGRRFLDCIWSLLCESRPQRPRFAGDTGPKQARRHEWRLLIFCR
jgi:hypothetical protein